MFPFRDILLLEAGFLSILVAPFSNSSVRRLRKVSVYNEVPFFLIKWLLFRLMFASGVVKLQSGCPTWWGLTGIQFGILFKMLQMFVHQKLY